MAVSTSFRSFVLEQLGRIAPNVRARSMFGGVGIYGSGYFFALIADDTLFFKVDDATRPAYVARGMAAFRPYGDEAEVMHYYQVAEELLEDPETLASWVADAIAVAQRARRKSRRAGSA